MPRSRTSEGRRRNSRRSFYVGEPGNRGIENRRLTFSHAAEVREPETRAGRSRSEKGWLLHPRNQRFARSIEAPNRAWTRWNLNTIMIRSFRCVETQKLFSDRPSKKFRSISRPARRKLEMMHAAQELNDLRNPPGNRLEMLKGDRWPAQHSHQRSVSDLFPLG